MSTVFDEQPDLGDQDLPNMDLEDRHALRRVAGLSTELQDISEVEYRALRLERVVLIGVWAEGSLASAENSLRELSRLAETAGSEVLDGLIQRRSRIDAATYVGSGKARELAGIVAAAGADTVICDGELTPSQLRNLDTLIAEATGVPTFVAEDPQQCVVKGTGVALENLDAYKRSIFTS